MRVLNACPHLVILRDKMGICKAVLARVAHSQIAADLAEHVKTTLPKNDTRMLDVKIECIHESVLAQELENEVKAKQNKA